MNSKFTRALRTIMLVVGSLALNIGVQSTAFAQTTIKAPTEGIANALNRLLPFVAFIIVFVQIGLLVLCVGVALWIAWEYHRERNTNPNAFAAWRQGTQHEFIVLLAVLAIVGVIEFTAQVFGVSVLGDVIGGRASFTA